LPPEIEYKASVERDLRKIDKKQAARILENIEAALGENPDAGAALKGQYKGLFKLRIGDYRVMYAKTKRGVLVLRIRHIAKAY